MWMYFESQQKQQNIWTNLVAVFFGKAKDELSALWGGVGGIKNLKGTNEMSGLRHTAAHNQILLL